MAGKLRPNDSLLIDGGVESTRYELGKHTFKGGFYPEYAFDGTTKNSNVFNPLTYMIITFFENVNIYRCGSTFMGKAKLTIYRKNDITGDFVDITENITQNLSYLGTSTWQLYIKELPKGTYKFENRSKNESQANGEWFLEKAYPKILLKENNSFYSILEEHYDSITGSYTPVPITSFHDNKVNIKKLFEEVTINGETFRPIDKFQNFRIILEELNSVSFTAIKSARELVVSKDDIDISISSFIHYFTLHHLCENNGTIKLAISYDQGQTWYTNQNSTFIPLPITIPVKPYQALNSNELNIWNHAKNCIYSNGIDKDALYSTNFNSVLSLSKKLRFAYVIDRPSTADTANVNNLTWNFDAKGHLDKMKDSEYNVSIYEHSAKITSLIENALLKVNIMI